MARKGRTDRGLLQRKNAQGQMSWYVRLYHNGQERRFGSFSTKTKAREFYEKAKMEQKEERFFPQRFQQNGIPLAQDWIQTYLTTLPNSGKAKKTQQEEFRYGHWWIKQLAGKRLTHITPANLDEVKQALVNAGYAPETIKHYLKFLRHVLNLAVRDQILEQNPFAKFTMPKIGQGHTRFLTIEEEQFLLKRLGNPYGQWARLAILTGLRKTEFFSLRWAHVDLEQGFVTLPQTKSGQVQYAPLNDEAKNILREFPSWEHSIWVFPSKSLGTHLDSYNFYGRVFLPAVKAAKLEGVTWHTLRHTFASRLAMNGQSDSTIAALLRHSGTHLVQRYAHLSPTHLKGAVEGVSQFGRTSDQPAKIEGNKENISEEIPKGTVTKTGNDGINEKGEIT